MYYCENKGRPLFYFGDKKISKINKVRRDYVVFLENGQRQNETKESRSLQPHYITS